MFWGVFLPIIRSLMTAGTAPVLPLYRDDSCAVFVVGQCINY